MSTTATSTDPAALRYQCGSGCGTLTFSWGRRMPDNGRLGTATLGAFVNKPIQVFDRQEIRFGNVLVGYNWGFQAQDGSFLGRMYVSEPGQSFIRFAKFRPNDQWPQVFCATPTPDSRDSREGIERVK